MRETQIFHRINMYLSCEFAVSSPQLHLSEIPKAAQVRLCRSCSINVRTYINRLPDFGLVR